MRRILALVTALGLLAAACASDDSFENGAPQNRAVDPSSREDPGTEPVIDIGDETVRLTSSLSGFADCAALLDHLRTEGSERVGPWGFDQGWFGIMPFAEGFVEVDGDMADAAADTAPEEPALAAPDSPAANGGFEDADESGGSLTEGVDFSGTNVQETGVDEADVVKTDGERVFIVANGEFVVVDVADRSVGGTIEVPEGDRAELFVTGDDVLLVNQGWDELSRGAPAPDVAVDSFGPHPMGTSRTTVTRIGLDGTTPRILETLSAEGDYVSARAVDGTARIIVRSDPQQAFPFVFPQGEAGEERAEEINREAVLGSELEDWLPSYSRSDADGSVTDEGLLVPCEQVHAPSEFAGFGVLSVLSVEVGGTIDPATTSSVLAPGDIVYASPASVYVATTTWFDAALAEEVGDQIQQNLTTSIHRFDIGSSTSAAYTASGSVEGVVRDSYSFSEHAGHLRVVTTTDENGADSSESFVRVLRENDDALEEVGSVGNLGNGEAVQSVRFQGDIGYVVTFRQIDPFYTIDLSDPENPAVLGELKIPGFSSYLHPIGDGTVIGVGSEADEETGQVTGAKVSLFDVSDLANPAEVATWSVPNAGNDVGWDPRAFLWWEAEDLAVVPIQLWDQGNRWAGVVLLRITDGTITEVGRIDHTDETSTDGQTDCTVVSEDDLPATDPAQFSSELEFMLVDGYGLVLDCGPNDERSATGFDCFEEPWVAEDAERIGLDAQGTIVMCHPIGNGVPTIARSMVLPGGELWTVSSPWGWLGGSNPARLQVNDLTSLERLGALDL